MWNVDCLVKKGGDTIGALLTNIVTRETQRIERDNFHKLLDANLYNAECRRTDDGVVLAGKRGQGGLKTITVEELMAVDAKQKQLATESALSHGKIGWTHSLMCLDIEVARLTVIEAGGIVKIEVLHEKYLPVGVKPTTVSIYNWLARRRIPASRAHLKRMEWVIGSIDLAVIRSLGLCLSDSYWIKPAGVPKTWADVNFFTNDFTDDVGDYLMTEALGGVDVNSPSINTEGMVPKKWAIVNGKRRLIKGTMDSNFWQYNEVAAYKIGKALGLQVLPYGLCDGNKHCFCPCMVQPGQNLVTADDILREKLGSHSSTESGWYDNNPYFYDVLCAEFGREYIDGVILFDYVIRNRDRHTRNLARIQDAKSRRFLKNSHIFDNGSSLMESYDPLTKDFHVSIGKRIRDGSRPYCSPQSVQIGLIDKSPFLPKLRECAENGTIGTVIRDTYKTSRIPAEVINALAIYVDSLVADLLR